MISKVKNYFSSRTCLLPSAITPMQKIGCITFSLTGLALALSTGLYFGNTYIKQTPEIIINSLPRLPQTSAYIPQYRIYGSMTAIMGITSFFTTYVLLGTTRHTYRVIKNTTECCNIIRTTAFQGIITPIYAVSTIVSFFLMCEFYKMTKKELSN